MDAYSVMVTGAFAEPIAISGRDTGFATAAATALCASARPARGSDNVAAMPTPARVRRKPFTGCSGWPGRGRLLGHAGLLLLGGGFRRIRRAYGAPGVDRPLV